VDHPSQSSSVLGVIMNKIFRIWVRLNDQYRHYGHEFFNNFPIESMQDMDQQMNDIDHLWLGQPL
jgi:hypothetical protein